MTDPDIAQHDELDGPEDESANDTEQAANREEDLRLPQDPNDSQDIRFVPDEDADTEETEEVSPEPTVESETAEDIPADDDADDADTLEKDLGNL